MIERLLRPRSVAIVGASQSPGALGATVLANLQRLGFRGDIHLINPNRAQIGDRPCLRSIEQLPLGVDAAVLAIPRAAVLEALAGLARRQIGSVVIFSAGFAEDGESGRAEQREIARIAAEHGLLVEGPNCLGLVNHVDGVALTFVETHRAPLEGRPGIGIVSQSGAMACVLGSVLANRGLDVSYVISTGNEAASSSEDFIEFLLGDPQTPVIGLIVEQFRQPRRLLSLARRARQAGKRLVLLHPGRSSAARASAATHTGALAGDHALMWAKVEAEGIIGVETLEELGDVLQITLSARGPSGPGAAVVTESGAFKALALDLGEQLSLTLPLLDEQNAPALRAALPPFVPVSNPLDLTAQALVDPDIYRRTLLALAADTRIGAIVLGIIQTDAATCERKFPAILAALRELKSAALIVFAGIDEGAPVPDPYRQALASLAIPYFPTAERAIRAVARLCAAVSHAPPTPLAPVAPVALGGAPLPSGVMPEYRAKDVLGALGVPFPARVFVQTLEHALQAADTLGYPVALKAQSAALAHKSDAGGVRLGLGEPTSLRAGWQALHADLARRRPGLALDGVLVERMAPPGLELIIGGRNDPHWGPVVLAGFGGVLAELLGDVRLLLPGQPRAAIIAALRALKCGPLLEGHRGGMPLDLPALAALIELIGATLVSQPAIAEIDLNPVIAYPQGQGVLALDALMLLSHPLDTASGTPAGAR